MDQSQSPEKESSPKGTRTLSNGAEQDPKTGQIVKPAPGSLFNSESAKAAALKKKEKKERMQEQARQAVVRAVKKGKHVDVADFEEAHGVIVETLVEEVILNDATDDHGKAVVQGKARAETYRMVLAMEGTLEKDLKSLDAPLGVEGASLTLGPEAAKYLIDRLAGIMEKRMSNADAVDGEFMDA